MQPTLQNLFSNRIVVTILALGLFVIGFILSLTVVRQLIGSIAQALSIPAPLVGALATILCALPSLVFAYKFGAYGFGKKRSH